MLFLVDAISVIVQAFGVVTSLCGETFVVVSDVKEQTCSLMRVDKCDNMRYYHIITEGSRVIYLYRILCQTIDKVTKMTC